MRYIDPFIKIQPPIHIFFHLYLNATVSSYPCPLGLVPQLVLDHFVLVIRQ